jgi:hypothetical protein
VVVPLLLTSLFVPPVGASDIYAVSPDPVRVGGPIIVADGGRTCSTGNTPGDRIYIKVYRKTPPYEKYILRGDAAVDSHGKWAVTIQIPASAPVGPYEISALCEIDHHAYPMPSDRTSVLGAVPTTTEPPPAVPPRPVHRAPNYTG